MGYLFYPSIIGYPQFVEIFEYRHWRIWNVGSSVTFAATPDTDVRLMLRSLSSETAIVDLQVLVDDPDLPETLRHTELVLHSDPGGAVSENQKLKDRTPVEKIVRPSKEPEPEPRIVAEGTEIIDAAGEEFVCRWIERHGRQNGLEVRCKIWESERVPGGIVRMVEEFPDLGRTATLEWLLKSSERR